MVAFRCRFVVGLATMLLGLLVATCASASVKPVARITLGHTVTLHGPNIKAGNLVACLISGRVYTARIPHYPGTGGKDVLTTPSHSLELRWVSRTRLRFACI
jgi:hypothetical protein